MLHVGTKNLSSNKPSEQRFQEVLHLIELLKLKTPIVVSNIVPCDDCMKI